MNDKYKCPVVIVVKEDISFPCERPKDHGGQHLYTLRADPIPSEGSLTDSRSSAEDTAFKIYLRYRPI